MLSEAYIERVVSHYAKINGWLPFKFVSPGNDGVPDHIYFKKGQTLMIEFKSPWGHLSPLQKAQIKRLRMAGMKVYVIDNIEKGKYVFA